LGRGLLVGQTVLFEGDRVITTKGDSAHKLRAKTFATVRSVNRLRKTLHLRLDDGRRVTVSAKEFPHLTLGYCTTLRPVPKGEGPEFTYVLLSDALGNQNLRGFAPEKTKVYAVDDRSEVKEVACRVDRGSKPSKRRNQSPECNLGQHR